MFSTGIQAQFDTPINSEPSRRASRDIVRMSWPPARAWPTWKDHRSEGRLPHGHARADMVACARYFEYYGGAADKVHGDTIPFLPGYLVTTEHVAHGVVGHVIPWNYPAQMFGPHRAPALAMGNACMVKPAEDACLTPLRLAELAAEVGLPRGARSTSCRASARPLARRCRPIAGSTSSPSRGRPRSAR